MSKTVSQKFGEYIQECRIKRNLPLRKVAAALDIDTSTLSKIEKGERQIKPEQILVISKTFDLDFKELQIKYLSRKIKDEFGNEPFFADVLRELLSSLK
ncbi:MAG: helix-turn-helix transcriptional regulator [Chitinophagaceae bacterium]